LGSEVFYMVQSTLKPIIIRLKKMRNCYKRQNMDTEAFYSVIAYDMKRLLVTNKEADRTFYVKWVDVELIRSEYIASQPYPTLGSKDVQRLRNAMKNLASALNKR